MTRHTIWRTLWAPYWIASDVPAPPFPGRRPARPAVAGPAGDRAVTVIDRLRRRLWLQRALHVLVRAAWLGLAAGCGWMLVELAGGPAFDPQPLIVAEAIFLAFGLVFAVLARPSRRQVARMLDRSFSLQERMTTALDNLGQAVPQSGERASIVYLQVADAANVVSEVRRHAAFRLRPPLRELVMAVACGLVLAALFFLRGVGGDIPSLAAGVVPAFTPAANRPAAAEMPSTTEGASPEAPSVAEVQQRARRSNDAQRDLLTLSQALDDYPFTRPAAESIQQGDYNQAADELRDLAQNADELSDTARQEMATDLDQAAAQMSPSSGDLANAARQAAAGLRQGEQAAEQGVRELGDAVEQTGSQVASQQELAEQMAQAQSAASSQSEAAQGETSQSGEQAQAGESGEPGQGDPESGADAQPGQGNEMGQGSQAGASQPGQNQGGQPGSGANPEDPAAGEDGQAGGEGEAAGQQPGTGADGSGDSQEASQGSGAGSGQDGTGEQPTGGGNAGETTGGEPGADGAPAESRVVAGGEEQADADLPGTANDDAIQLGRSSGEGVQTSNDSGSSSLGSGAGVTVGSGTAVQGEVGEAGPDSNRVPPEYRALVEAYFSDAPDGGETP